MNIGIDVTPLYGKEITGIGYYVYEIVKRLADIEKNHNFTFICFTSVKPRLHRELKSFLIKRLPEELNYNLFFIPIPSRIRFTAEFIPLNAFIPSRVDLFHCPYQLFAPLILRKPLISTIHDVFPLLNPGLTAIGRRKFLEFKKSYFLVSKRADIIITVSNYSKKDIIEKLGVKEDKIKVIYHGIDGEFFHPSLNEEILKKYKITKKFILYVGAIAPRKNLKRLVLGFERIKKRFNYQLVIVGPKGWLYPDFFQLLDQLPGKIREDIILTGYYTRKDLPCLYSHAEVFVLPSVYESFGLPVLEAMACGCPVITSNISAMPEVAGDSAVLVNPYSVDEIASSIKKVLSDEQLRKNMRLKGLERAKQFSWEKTARETLKVYKEVHEEV